MNDVPAVGGIGVCPECGSETRFVAIPDWDIRRESCGSCSYSFNTRLSTGEKFIPKDSGGSPPAEAGAEDRPTTSGD